MCRGVERLAGSLAVSILVVVAVLLARCFVVRVSWVVAAACSSFKVRVKIRAPMTHRSYPGPV